MARAKRTPYTPVRYQMPGVAAIDAVLKAIKSRLRVITRRGPTRSTSRPTKGWKRPFIKMATAAGKEMVARSQPNSALMGLRKLSKLL
jgi:hypothetical protein